MGRTGIIRDHSPHRVIDIRSAGNVESSPHPIAEKNAARNQLPLFNEISNQSVTRLRIAALLLLAGVLLAVGYHYHDRLTVDEIRMLVDQAGWWGAVLYVGLFVGAEMIQVPGWILITAGVAAFGPDWGYLLSLIAAILSVAVAFLITRGLGGKPLARTQRPMLRRLLAQIDHHPVRTVFVLRLIFWVSPPLNCALALTGIRFRHFLIGSALGLAPPLFVIARTGHWLIG